MSNTQLLKRCKNIPPYVPSNRHRYIPILAETTSFFSIFNCVICYNRELELRKVEQARLVFKSVAAPLCSEPVTWACKTSISFGKTPKFCCSSLSRLGRGISPAPGDAESSLLWNKIWPITFVGWGWRNLSCRQILTKIAEWKAMPLYPSSKTYQF